MSRDILNGFGPNSPSPKAATATNGGKMMPKDIPYSPPVGPKSINDAKSPGLHGTNHGNCPGQGRH